MSIQAMATQTPLEVEARYRRADGAWRILHTRAEPRFDASRQFQGMVGVNTDVTDQRRAVMRDSGAGSSSGGSAMRWSVRPSTTIHPIDATTSTMMASVMATR